MFRPILLTSALAACANPAADLAGGWEGVGGLGSGAEAVAMTATLEATDAETLSFTSADLDLSGVTLRYLDGEDTIPTDPRFEGVADGVSFELRETPVDDCRVILLRGYTDPVEASPWFNGVPEGSGCEAPIPQ